MPRGASGVLVELESVVADPQGHLAPDLKAADFALESDRKLRIQECVYVDTRERRTMVFLVDDLGLSAASMAAVREAIQKFVASELHPADRLAILRSGQGQGSLQELTGNPEDLTPAIAALGFNPRYAHYSSGSARNAAFASGALGALRVAVEGLRRLAGRKSLVLFSSGLADVPVADLNALAASARRAEVSVYGIDPTGALAEPVAPDAPNPPASGATPLEFTNFALAHLDAASGMAGLARQTGGELMAGAGRVETALRGALAGPDGYYRISYLVPDAFWQPRLTVVRRGYSLLNTRQVSEGAANLQGFGASRETEDDLSHAISEPFTTGGLEVRLTPLFFQTTSGSVVNALVFFNPKDITFRRGLDGVYHGKVEVLAAAFGATAQSVRHASLGFDLNWSETERQEALRIGSVAALKLPVPGATLQIRAVVRDSFNGKIGSASQWLEVPSMQQGTMALSGLTLYGAAEAGTNRAAMKDPFETPGVRIFRIGDPIHYRCEIYNLTQDAAKAAGASVQITILQPSGAELVQKALPVSFEPAGDSGVHVASGRILLRTGVAPGRYQLQFTVTDLLAAGGAPPTAVQYAEFELRP